MKLLLLPLISFFALSVQADYLYEYGNSTEWNKPNTPQGKSYRSPSSWTIYNDSTDLFPSIYPGGKTIRDMNGNILDCDADGNCYE